MYRRGSRQITSAQIESFYCELHCGYLFQIGITDEHFIVDRKNVGAEGARKFEGVYRVREEKS